MRFWDETAILLRRSANLVAESSIHGRISIILLRQPKREKDVVCEVSEDFFGLRCGAHGGERTTKGHQAVCATSTPPFGNSDEQEAVEAPIGVIAYRTRMEESKK